MLRQPFEGDVEGWSLWPPLLILLLFYFRVMAFRATRGISSVLVKSCTLLRTFMTSFSRKDWRRF